MAKKKTVKTAKKKPAPVKAEEVAPAGRRSMLSKNIPAKKNVARTNPSIAKEIKKAVAEGARVSWPWEVILDGKTRVWKVEKEIGTHPAYFLTAIRQVAYAYPELKVEYGWMDPQKTTVFTRTEGPYQKKTGKTRSPAFS